MKQSKYIEEVNRLLARIDGQQENTEPEREAPIPDTQEPIQDVYIQYVFIEREEDEDEQQYIDSTLTEPDTNVPPAPAPTPGDKGSERIAYGILSVSLLMVVSIIMLQLSLLINPPIATIVLIPKPQSIALNATLQLGRLLPPITVSQEKTVPTTGHGHQDARAATGTVTFYNGQFTQVFIPAGTLLTGNSGEQIITDQDAQIPPESQTIPPSLGYVTVTAHAITPGSNGNIPTGDINQKCCAPSILVQNTAFSGGQNERDFQTVTKQDIAHVASTLKTTLAQSMQGALTGQLQSGEALVTPTCTPKISADHQPGQEAIQVKVTVSEACSGVAYNSQQVETRATQLLTTKAGKKLGTGYSELGNPQVSVIQATAHNKTTMLSFSSQGLWVYGLSIAAQEQIKHLIAGKTKQEAMHILESQPGIERVSTAWNENTKLPKDTQYIHLVIFAGI